MRVAPWLALYLLPHFAAPHTVGIGRAGPAAKKALRQGDAGSAAGIGQVNTEQVRAEVMRRSESR